MIVKAYSRRPGKTVCGKDAAAELQGSMDRVSCDPIAVTGT